MSRQRRCREPIRVHSAKSTNPKRQKTRLPARVIKKLGRVFLLRDADVSFRASVLSLITAGSQSEMRTLTFCCKIRNIRQRSNLISQIQQSILTRAENFKRNYIASQQTDRTTYTVPVYTSVGKYKHINFFSEIC